MYNVSGYRVTGMVREKQKDWENLLLIIEQLSYDSFNGYHHESVYLLSLVLFLPASLRNSKKYLHSTYFAANELSHL